MVSIAPLFCQRLGSISRRRVWLVVTLVLRVVASLGFSEWALGKILILECILRTHRTLRLIFFQIWPRGNPISSLTATWSSDLNLTVLVRQVWLDECRRVVVHDLVNERAGLIGLHI
jgi:hypothetical protein